jgi:hypothetical protein
MTIFAVAYVSIAVALALYLSLVVTVFTTKYRPWRWH